jgi:hypothetical protein
MAQEIKYKFANYDGGLEAHPVAERAGSFVLSGSWWELHFKHTYEIANGELSDYLLEALPIDKKSCLVSIREPEDDGEILCSFVLPDTSAERLLSDLDQRSGELEAGDADPAVSHDGSADPGQKEPTDFPVRMKELAGQQLQLAPRSRFYELRSRDDQLAALLDLYGASGDLVRLVCADGSWRVNERHKHGWDLVIESADGRPVGSYAGRHWVSGGTICLADGGEADLRQSPFGVLNLRVASTREPIATIRGRKLTVHSLPAEIYSRAEVLVLTACAVPLLTPKGPGGPTS